MSRTPGDRAINHGGIGWVEPAPGGAAPDTDLAAFLKRARIAAQMPLAGYSRPPAAEPTDVVTPGVPRWPWEHTDLGEWTAETVAPHRAAGCELTAPCKLRPLADG